DKSGFVEVVAWPDVYRKSVEFLNSDDPIYVKGRMEVGEERMQIFANEITSLAQEVAKSRLNGGANGKTNGHGNPSTRAQVIATGRSVKIPPRLQGDALAEATEPKWTKLMPGVRLRDSSGFTYTCANLKFLRTS